MWKLRNLTIEGKIVVFKSLAISKLIHLALVTEIPTSYNVSLQCSWIKRLFNNNFHQWKLIPLYLIRQYFGKNFKFHSNSDVIQFYASFLNSIKRYSDDGVNIFLHRLLCRQQLYVSLFDMISIFKLVIKAFICVISRIGI